MRPMREKKPQAMLAMGGRVGAPPPQTAPLSPYTRPVHTRHSGGCWWGLGVGIGAQYTGFFSACRPNFFFFSAKPGPCPHTLGGYFPDFFSDSPVRIQYGQWSPEKIRRKISLKKILSYLTHQNPSQAL